MKQQDVRIGGIYLTRVSGSLVSVEVLHVATPVIGRRAAYVVRHSHMHRDGSVTFGAVLPKARTASALRIK